ANIGAGAQVVVNIQAVVGAKQLVAQQPGGAPLGQHLIESGGNVPELAAQVVVGHVGLGGVSGDHHPLQELVGVLLHDLAVFEGAGLGLVGVDRQVARVDALGQEAPLQAGGKAGAA